MLETVYTACAGTLRATPAHINIMLAALSASGKNVQDSDTSHLTQDNKRPGYGPPLHRNKLSMTEKPWCISAPCTNPATCATVGYTPAIAAPPTEPSPAHVLQPGVPVAVAPPPAVSQYRKHPLTSAYCRMGPTSCWTPPLPLHLVCTKHLRCSILLQSSLSPSPPCPTSSTLAPLAASAACCCLSHHWGLHRAGSAHCSHALLEPLMLRYRRLRHQLGLPRACSACYHALPVWLPAPGHPQPHADLLVQESETL